jgi:hypothetical protein
MLKPLGSAGGDGFDAFLVNGVASIPLLPIDTLSGPAIVPAVSRYQPLDPALLAVSVKSPPNGVVAVSESNFSLTFAWLSPAVDAPADENVCVKCAS